MSGRTTAPALGAGTKGGGAAAARARAAGAAARARAAGAAPEGPAQYSGSASASKAGSKLSVGGGRAGAAAAGGTEVAAAVAVRAGLEADGIESGTRLTGSTVEGRATRSKEGTVASKPRLAVARAGRSVDGAKAGADGSKRGLFDACVATTRAGASPGLAVRDRSSKGLVRGCPAKLKAAALATSAGVTAGART